MIKLLFLILLALVLTAWGIVHYTGGSTVKVGSDEVNVSSPSDTINAAKGAVGQTQDLQNRINRKADSQLNQ